MANELEADRLLAQAVGFAHAGNRQQAYDMLLNVVEIDSYNEVAWLWLSMVTDNLDDRRICLENVLTINPENVMARARLADLSGNGHGISPRHILCPQCGAGNRDFVRECQACGYAFFRRCPICGESNLTEAQSCSQCGAQLAPMSSQGGAADPQPEPASLAGLATSHTALPYTVWPVIAFWFGTSLLFLGGGAASLYQFATMLLYARGVMQNLAPNQLAWLPTGLFFIVFGFTAISLAWQLAHRQGGGYYGSLVFGLLLALLGPGASLVLVPPDYLTTACTGLMPAAVVLFTLASMAGFDS